MMYEGDSREVLKQFEDNSFDSIVTDPPYELAFMGKKWDASGIAYDVELWQECFRVLKPGGYLLSFGGTRTYHRMACAIEDAGFEIRDSIHWVYGSGFPKTMDISKQLDKMAGAEREILGPKPYTSPDIRANNLMNSQGKDRMRNCESIPATEAAKTWDGWGTALKPAHEPIVMARKPISEKTVASNVLKWGTGGINIDACRIKGRGEKTTGGRSPANLIHDGSEEVLAEFAKAGERKSGASIRYPGETVLRGATGIARGDTGTADRFFKECPPDIPSIIYTSKASKKERGGSTHPTIKPLSLISYLVRMVTPKGGIVLDPFLGSGTLALAAEAEGMQWVGVDLDLTEARRRLKCQKM